MMKNIKKSAQRIFTSLYWRISFAFLIILSVLAFLYVYTTARSAELYFQETTQELNSGIAEQIARDIQPFVDGKVNEEALKDLFHSVMVIHPSIEVYLLDTTGKILTYFAPKSKVVMDTVPLQPMHSFIKSEEKALIKGPDPRHPKKEKIFSAAKVKQEGEHFGYIYIVLAGEEYESATALVFGSYRLRIASQGIIITFLAAFLIGLIAIWLITRNLHRLKKAVMKFQNGDLDARARVKGGGEFAHLAEAFNSMADKIVRNIEEIKSVEKLRRELIGNISHDLRTPLATIQGYSETLLMKSDELEDEERNRYTGIILNSTTRIKKMVDELFELSKLEAKQVEVQYEPFSLPELVQDIMQKYQIVADEHNIALKTDLPKDLPFIYADIGLIDRVIQNLLENAIKYTPKGGEVMIESVITDDGVKLLISDTGIGISEDELPHIFDRYMRGNTEKAGEEEQEGTGLGLTIVKKILELHNTTIQVFSKPEKGTTFSFVLNSYQ